MGQTQLPRSSIMRPFSKAQTHRPRSSTLRPFSIGHGTHSPFSFKAVLGGQTHSPSGVWTNPLISHIGTENKSNYRYYKYGSLKIQGVRKLHAGNVGVDTNVSRSCNIVTLTYDKVKVKF